TEKIYEVVGRIAKKCRIDIVLEKGSVLYGGGDLDLTSQVIEELKKEVKSEEKGKVRDEGKKEE
ncbi:MAG: hypothetical protein QME40_00980, partial [bacterium]|nr:hypothetical protein [bacterium]